MARSIAACLAGVLSGIAQLWPHGFKWKYSGAGAKVAAKTLQRESP